MVPCRNSAGAVDGERAAGGDLARSPAQQQRGDAAPPSGADEGDARPGRGAGRRAGTNASTSTPTQAAPKHDQHRRQRRAATRSESVTCQPPGVHRCGSASDVAHGRADRRVDHVEQRLRVEAEHDDQRDQRRHDGQLAQVEVGTRSGAAGAVERGGGAAAAPSAADRSGRPSATRSTPRGGPCMVRWNISST